MEYLVVLGAFVNLGGASIYVWDTLKGRSQPNRVSFFLWALAPMIAVVAALVQGVTWAVLPGFIAGFGPLLVLLASFRNKNAIWKLGPFDWACGALSLAALLLWLITKNPNIAILFAILSDGAACVPTLKKGWTHPESETIWLYVTGIFSATTGILVAKNMGFSEIAFPVYLLIIDLALAESILAGRWRKGKLNQTGCPLSRA